MPEFESAPYGSWKSPITSDLIVSGSIGLSEPLIDGSDVYWLELRPTEGGRSVIVKRSGGSEIRDVIPPPYNARTRVHEYGGGDYAVRDGVVYFSNFSDQRVYEQRGEGPPRPITPTSEFRYADMIIDQARRCLICVREDHSIAGKEAVNTLVSLDLTGAETAGQVLVSGNDFYSSPRLSPDGSWLAWLTWNHPNMPWDGTELWVAEVGSDGLLLTSKCVAGGPDESIFQPEWSPDGTLYFVSDRTGWWNLYRLNSPDLSLPDRGEPRCEMRAELGMPQWGSGTSPYAFESAQRIVCPYIKDGIFRLALLDTASKKLEPVDCPYSDIPFVQASPGQAVMRAGSPTEANAIVKLDLETRQFSALRRSDNLQIDPGYFSIPQPVEFPTEDGVTAYGFFYPPANGDYRAPEGELPPLLVKSHGGPTAAATTALSLRTQYWTSRGIAVLDVNYGGSTGFGREYRERLKDKWGIVDVDDCANGGGFLGR